MRVTRDEGKLQPGWWEGPTTRMHVAPFVPNTPRHDAYTPIPCRLSCVCPVLTGDPGRCGAAQERDGRREEVGAAAALAGRLQVRLTPPPLSTCSAFSFSFSCVLLLPFLPSYFFFSLHRFYIPQHLCSAPFFHTTHTPTLCTQSHGHHGHGRGRPRRGYGQASPRPGPPGPVGRRVHRHEPPR